MVATHLNAPYGNAVTAAEAALALCAGSLADVQSELSRALLMTMFIECAPQSILSAALEAGSSWRMNALLGGGTRVMLAIEHRISQDIDLFVHDAQWIGFLTPRLNDKLEDRLD